MDLTFWHPGAAPVYRDVPQAGSREVTTIADMPTHGHDVHTLPASRSSMPSCQPACTSGQQPVHAFPPTTITAAANSANAIRPSTNTLGLSDGAPGGRRGSALASGYTGPSHVHTAHVTITARIMSTE